MNQKEHIFKPIRIGPLTLKNRIEVAPAAPFMTGHDASVSQEFYEYTMGLAKSGAGVVTIGVTGVDPRQPIGMRTLNAGSMIYLSDLNDIAEGIQRNGAAASIELVHSRFMLTPPEQVVNGTTTAEVEEVIRLFAEAAERCRQAGFDMIMIHGGHGNVPSMFFNKKFNRRTDRFGGSFENRCNFGRELLGAIREKTQGKIAVEYRISAEEMLPDMTTFEETLAYAEVIQDSIDLLHVSRGLLEVNALLPYINAPVYLPRAMNLPFARVFKETLNIPVSVVGSFDLELAEKAIAEGDVDMVAMIRTVLADTACVKKASRGRDSEIRPCIRCNVCISRTHSMFETVRCAVNPVIGRETRFDLRHPETSKRVAVIGGGPAGLEAARTASERGHKVTLFELSPELGGTFKLACAADFKQDMRSYLDWSIHTVKEDPNIELRLNTKPTRVQLAEEHFDALFVAIGAEPILPKFTASGTSKLLWAGDAELAPHKVGKNVIIAGAGFTGMELALSLARKGKQVRLIDLLPEEEIGAGGSPINLICLKDLLKREHVEFICSVRMEDVTEEGVWITRTDGTRELLTCDTVILSLGFRPSAEKLAEYDGIAEETFVIGDCAGKGGTVWNATRTAFDRVMQL